MEIKSAAFVVSNSDYRKCPDTGLPEYAFIGRSNVGKSSLINMLTNSKDLAKTSSQPGKTQLINHFVINDSWYIVDLPGYGFAKTNHSNRDQWSSFIGKYLSESEHLNMVCQLIDIRHKPLDSDMECYAWLLECGLDVQIVLTKADKLSKSAAEAQKALFKRELGIFEDQIITYSSTQHTMRGELISRIMKKVQ